MSFGEAIKVCFEKYATFSGRARRSEYWYFYLFTFLVSLGLGCIPFLGLLSFVWWFAILIPSLAVTVRRFHDIGKSGWNYLIILIPELLLYCYMFYTIFHLIKEWIINNGVVKNFLDGGSLSLNLLCGLIPINIIAIILWLFWLTGDSQPGENKWGPNPKEVPSNNNSGMN